MYFLWVLLTKIWNKTFNLIFSEVVSQFYDYQNFKSVCIQFSVIQFWTSLSTKLCKQNELRNFNDLSRISLMKMKPISALERILLKYTKISVSRCLAWASARELVSLPDHCSSSQGWQQIYSGTTLTMERLTLEKIISNPLSRTSK